MENYQGETVPKSLFVEGPFGSGKTTFAIQTMLQWLRDGVPADDILVMVPQRTLARQYQLALRNEDLGSIGNLQIRTLGGLAKDASNLFWPLVAEEAGFTSPDRAPQFLTIETSQYTMSRFVDEALDRGEFEAVKVSPQQIARQIVDNLGKAAILGIDYKEVPVRLVKAWGDKSLRQVYAYQAAGKVAEIFRNYCLKNRLLDYSLQVELFGRLLKKPTFRKQFLGRFSHLIVEHVEEEATFTHRFIEGWLSDLDAALLTYEWDGGYRVFLGANPTGGEALRDKCDGTLVLDESYISSPDVRALSHEVQRVFNPKTPAPPAGDPSVAFDYAFHNFFPDMLDWVAERIHHLVNEEGVAAREIAVMSPYLSDALRFSLKQKLAEKGIDVVSHRPSRALKEEPAARCLLTLAALAHPQWFNEPGTNLRHPPAEDVAQTLATAIEPLDPLRARLLTKVAYKPRREPALAKFAEMNADMQARITFVGGQHYDHVREFIMDYINNDRLEPLDHFFSHLFGEVLSQPGFGFHGDNYEGGRNDAGRVVGELVESARKFRRGLFGQVTDLDEIGKRYFMTVQQGLLAALYVASWRDELSDAVFLAPAYTFLMRNRPVDVQFWLDIGATGWWERLEQPLTHPYVLSSTWDPDQEWKDEHEYARQQEMLYKIMRGLLARCRSQVYLGISDLGEQGFEQRGPLLRVLQQILRRTRKVEVEV